MNYSSSLINLHFAGGATPDYGIRTEILEYVDGDEWKLVGNLQQEVVSHAATVIENLPPLCTVATTSTTTARTLSTTTSSAQTQGM